MNRVCFRLFDFYSRPESAFATWSVIAVDRATGGVVIGSATCVIETISS
jgi:hypothetical protein